MAVDEPVVELETEKATVELGAPNAGVLAEVPRRGGPGRRGRCGDRADRAGRLRARARGEARRGGARARATPEPARVAAAPTPAPAAAPAATTPRARRRARSRARAAQRTRRSHLSRRPDELPRRDGRRTHRALGPAARKLLAEHGLDPGAVAATGPGGRITKGDVLAHVGRRARASSPIAAAPATRLPTPREQRVKMTRLRRTIAARLVEAQHDRGDPHHVQRDRHERGDGAARALQGRVREEARRAARLHVVLRQARWSRRCAKCPR